MKDDSLYSETFKSIVKNRIIMNISMLLTYSRIPLGMIFALLTYLDLMVYAYIVLGVGILSDLLDGYLARNHGYATEWGKAADPGADKIFIFFVSLSLALKLSYPMWAFGFYVFKDSIMFFGALFALKKKMKVFGADYFGKIGTVVQFSSFIAWIFDFYGIYFVYAAVLGQLVAGVHYLFKFMRANR